MPSIIEIEGNIVRHIERSIVAETSLAALTPFIERRAPTLFPVLPNNTVLAGFDPDEKRGAIIVERPPERVNLHVWFDMGLTGTTPPADYNRATENDNRRAHFNIQLPYLYFVYGFKINPTQAEDHVGLAGFTLDRSTAWWRKEPLRRHNDRLWPAKLPNINGDGLICWGAPAYDNQDTLSMRINQMVNEFAVTLFTNHYGLPRPADYASYIEWEEASENPLCYRDWTFWDSNAGTKPADEYLLKMMQNGTGKNYGTMPRPEDMLDILIPEPPQQFTIGRLREWMETIPEPLRRRFLAEAARVGNEDDHDGGE